MNDIAARAGASKATLYARFPSKSALFAALMERRSRQSQARVALAAEQPPGAAAPPPAEVLGRFGTHLLRVMTSEENRRLHRLILAESERFPELTAAFWQNGPGRGREVLRHYLGAQVARGALAIENLDYAAEQFVGMLLGGTALRLNYRLPPLFANEAELARWVRSGVDAFLRAYGTGQPGARPGGPAPPA